MINNVPRSTNNSYSLDKSRANLVSLLWQAVGVFLIFLVMLVLTSGKPSSWMLSITFLIAGGFVVWAEAKREQRFYKRRSTALQLIQQLIEQDTFAQIGSSLPIDYLISGKIKEWNQWRIYERYMIEKEAYFRWTSGKANFRETNIMEADLMKVNLRGANLIEADLMKVNLRRANLIEANLRGANLRGANLIEANLRGANLWGANLIEADLRGANLRGANLRGANLWGADLRAADLRAAILNEAVVIDAFFGLNPGLTDENRAELEKIGAVFQDFPGDTLDILVKK